MERLSSSQTVLAGLPGLHQTQPGGQVIGPLFEGARPDPSVFISFINSFSESLWVFQIVAVSNVRGQ